ncbi:AmmeMemoRadiSam system radical SAM enzyme [Fundidesulfovibrio butyratiphilus]
MTAPGHEARLWKALPDNKVACRLCSHFCVVEPGARGKCGVRLNHEGSLRTLVYDRAAAVNVDPVEKKPLFHFLPGTRTFSYGTMGCNLACAFCQNDTLSQSPRQGLPIEGHPVTPALLVDAARRSECLSLSATYSEPTVFFELMSDTARLASEQGLKNIIVSNGFMSSQCLDELGPIIHAANIDLKAFTESFYADVCQARLDPVKKNLAHMLKLGWWVEVTTLVIPGLNDSDRELGAIAGFIADELGQDVPWHVSRFHPCFRMTDRESTPPQTLERAWDIGRAAGLRYVYVGNLPGAGREDTLCPACGRTVLSRQGFLVGQRHVKNGACAFCGAALAGLFPD